MSVSEKKEAKKRLDEMTPADKAYIMRRLIERAADPANHIVAPPKESVKARRERLAAKRAQDACYREAKAERVRERKSRKR